jgi:hypothetical protein
METTSQNIKLNLDKVINFLDRYHYTTVRLYCRENIIIFLECKTPKFQKTIIIYFPERYYVPLPENCLIKIINLKSSEISPTKYQLQFISDVKGHLMECDILAISSDTILFHSEDKGLKYFCIGNEDIKPSTDEEELDISSSDDEVSKLKKKVNSMMKLVGSKNASKIKSKKKKSKKRPSKGILVNAQEISPEDEPPTSALSGGNASSKEEDALPPKEEEKVELLFIQDDGEVIDEVKSAIENPNETLKKIKKKVDYSSDEENVEIETGDNSLPPDIEEQNIYLGIVYVSINIQRFYKIIETYEEEVINLYIQIEDNENDMRAIKVTHIKELCQRFIGHMEGKIKELNSEEEDLKNQLLNLTVIMTQTLIIKQRVDKNPEKYGVELVEEVGKMHDETRKSINDINIEILKIRDKTEEILCNYAITMQTIFSI